MFVVFNPLELT